MSQLQELVIKLKDLLIKIEELDIAQQERDAAETALTSPALYPSHLKDFDDIYLEKYISEKIGLRPVEPNGVIKVLLPVYLIQKAQYDAAHATYEKMRPLAEAAYREAYQSERENLRVQDEEEGVELEKAAKARLALAESRLSSAKECLETNTTIHSSLKHCEIVRKLISYLEENRADSLKEAINLYYDEKRKDEEAQKSEVHRQEMLALEEEKVRAAQAAEEYQRLQYEEARRAAYYAQQASDSVRDAAETAKDMRIDHLYDDV